MILVTGASGFLGQHLLQALAQGNQQVRALYHSRAQQVSHANIQWQSCDLLDLFAVADAMKGIDKVYHCAATVSFDSRQRNQLIDNNINATTHVVNAALEAGIQKLIHVSSIAALGRSQVKEKGTLLDIDETTYWEEDKNNSAYAESKYHAEMEVWRAMAEGLPAVIVNPPVMLGEGDFSRGSAHLMQVVDQEFPWYTSGVNAWVDVQDVVKAMCLLMESEISEERYIISAGNYSYREVFTMMADALGKRPPYKRAGAWMTEMVWRLEVLKSRLSNKPATISKETARTAQLDCRYDNSKFLRAFPEFTYERLETTIRRMAAAYQL